MVRQLFEVGVLQSGFWHQFDDRAQSCWLVSRDLVWKEKPKQLELFANNDINYTDSTGIDHDKFSFGLKRILVQFHARNMF
jgi:hypothetical protein